MVLLDLFRSALLVQLLYVVVDVRLNYSDGLQFLPLGLQMVLFQVESVLKMDKLTSLLVNLVDVAEAQIQWLVLNGPVIQFVQHFFLNAFC